MKDALCIETLSVDDLQVDSAYQRILNIRRAESYARKFDATLFGVLCVGRRKNGSLWVADGQHRWHLAKYLGMTELVCEVFKSRGRAHEASVFVQRNYASVKVGSMDRYRAEVAMGDKDSISIMAAVESAGMQIDVDSRHRNKWPFLRCIGHLKNVYRRGQADHLSRVIATVVAAWEGEQDATQGTLIDGLSWCYAKYPTMKDKRMASKLSALKPLSVTRFAEDHQKLIGGGRVPHVGKAYLAIYNKGLRQKLGTTDETINQ